LQNSDFSRKQIESANSQWDNKKGPLCSSDPANPVNNAWNIELSPLNIAAIDKAAFTQ
jgi:hypothetical protein